MTKALGRIAVAGRLAACALLALGCQRPGDEGGPEQGRAASPVSAPVRLEGGGATFPALLYERWISAHAAQRPQVWLSYDAVGSEVGMAALSRGEVSFAGTEIPLEFGPDDPFVQIPVTLGAVAIIYNLPDVSATLRLTPEVLADIFLGEIGRWDDERIRRLNPGTWLPRLPIEVAYRQDSSGTTAIFSHFLARQSTRWRDRVGQGQSVPFPMGRGWRGSAGVAGWVKSTPGAIGYVQFTFAEEIGLPMAALRNQAGQFVAPRPEVLAASPSDIEPPTSPAAAGYLTELACAHCYSLTGISHVVVAREQHDRLVGEALTAFLWWAIHDGQRIAAESGYAALSAPLVEVAQARVERLEWRGRRLLLEPHVIPRVVGAPPAR